MNTPTEKLPGAYSFFEANQYLKQLMGHGHVSDVCAVPGKDDQTINVSCASLIEGKRGKPDCAINIPLRHIGERALIDELAGRFPFAFPEYEPANRQ